MSPDLIRRKKTASKKDRSSLKNGYYIITVFFFRISAVDTYFRLEADHETVSPPETFTKRRKRSIDVTNPWMEVWFSKELI